jgi:hypothetical protein
MSEEGSLQICPKCGRINEYCVCNKCSAYTHGQHKFKNGKCLCGLDEFKSTPLTNQQEGFPSEIELMEADRDITCSPVDVKQAVNKNIKLCLSAHNSIIAKARREIVEKLPTMSGSFCKYIRKSDVLDLFK